MTTTDALVLPLHSLPRQLGSRLEVHREWTVPEDFGTSSMSVRPGTVLDLPIELTSVEDGVLARVRVDVDLEGECVRCLDLVVHHHEVEASDVWFEPGSRTVTMMLESGEGDEDAPSPEDVPMISPRDTIDVEPLLRDAVLTLVEDRPLCRPDCRGLCPGCGEKWEDLPEDHAHEVIDPRLAGLAAFFDQGEE